MISTTDEPARVHGNHEDANYDAFLDRLHTRFTTTANARGALFTTDATGLWDAYLGAFPAHRRQYHNCNACRHFVERFGSLVFIAEDGTAAPAMWNENEANPEELLAIGLMQRLVQRAKVTGVFLSGDEVLGTPSTGVWRHLAVVLPTPMVHSGVLLTAGQAMAEKREDFKNMQRALGEFTRDQIDTALKLLNAEALYRAEKVIGPAQFLSDLLAIREASPRADVRTNLTWRRIASAPAGFCHPRSSMIGSLLEDIAEGMGFDRVSVRFAAKMQPLAYQRPQAAPSAGAIAAAEKVFEKLGAGGALARRYALVEDLRALWKPKPAAEANPSGLFGHLHPKPSTPSAADMVVPPITMTFDKFRRIVLPTADRIEVFARIGVDNWCTFVTAENPGAAPILQWDSLEARNPVSWYVYSGGSPAAQYGIKPGQFHQVAAVVLKPTMWGGEDAFTHHGKSVTFVVDGARDTRKAGAALFPEILRSEFHGVRGVLEAYSRDASISGMDGPQAVGPGLGIGDASSVRLRVTSAGSALTYLLDRWD